MESEVYVWDDAIILRYHFGQNGLASFFESTDFRRWMRKAEKYPGLVRYHFRVSETNSEHVSRIEFIIDFWMET